ncbi:hypothetical protein I316_01100 [Kwoniella heveanensis BCC8398]|uniref:RNase III domain-containing protein n=1 Tax=Kwoniella heveanensis BCC8398 TaxID=1296120 RepID=A0A1B9H1P8_9TREE|nr:hypothetical protein I316_01100 [Kwoniella heveanensis BCC8398]
MRYQTPNNPLFSFILPPLPAFPIPPLPQIHHPKLHTNVISHTSLQGLNRRGNIALSPPEEGWEVAGDYERLEHIGDGLLESIASGLIYDLYPWLRQGGAAIIRDYLVSNATLAQISIFYDLPALLRADPSNIEDVRKSEKVQASIFEAWIAGVFYDYLQGYGYSDANTAAGELVAEECGPDDNEVNDQDEEEALDEEEDIPTIVMDDQANTIESEGRGRSGGVGHTLLSISMAPLVPDQRSHTPTTSGGAFGTAHARSVERTGGRARANTANSTTGGIFSFHDLEKMVGRMIAESKTTTSTITTTKTVTSATTITITRDRTRNNDEAALSGDLKHAHAPAYDPLSASSFTEISTDCSPTLNDLALTRSASTTRLLERSGEDDKNSRVKLKSPLNPQVKAFQPSFVINDEPADRTAPLDRQRLWQGALAISREAEGHIAGPSHLTLSCSVAPIAALGSQYKRTKGQAYDYLVSWLTPLLTPYCQWMHTLLSAEQARIDASLPPIIPRLATPARWAEEDEEAHKQGSLRSLAQHPLVGVREKVRTGEAVRSSWKAARLVAAWKVLLQLNAQQQEIEHKSSRTRA